MSTTACDDQQSPQDWARTHGEPAPMPVQPAKPLALALSDWIDGAVAGSSWDARIKQTSAELRRLTAVEQERDALAVELADCKAALAAYSPAKALSESLSQAKAHGRRITAERDALAAEVERLRGAVRAPASLPSERVALGRLLADDEAGAWKDGPHDEAEELRDLCDKLGDILHRTAVALRGPEPELTRWTRHDLPDRAAAAIAGIDVMQRAAAYAAAARVPLTPAQQHAEELRSLLDGWVESFVDCIEGGEADEMVAATRAVLAKTEAAGQEGCAL